MLNKIGFYCWAGPGTIRMINLKYFNPNIDKSSLMKSYDYNYLAEVKEKFGVTDFWASYSWGFSDEIEKVDRKFLLDRIKNFKKLDIKVHAYVQGTNLVYEDFKHKDWWSLDEKGRLISYYRGRKVVCVNNPRFREYISGKIKTLYNTGVDGIYMDNVQMGQLGIAPYVFSGCNCRYCQNKNRMDSLMNFLTEMSEVAHKGRLKFGTNSYDPKLDLKRIIGVDLKRLEKIQDYILFENHSLPNGTENNLYIDKIAKEISKPVFVVSYKNGIGMEKEFSQEDFDNIYTEALNLKFYPCFKGSEYTTNGVWHNLNIEKFEKLKFKKFDEKEIKSKLNSEKLINFPAIRWMLKNYYNPMQTIFFENYFVRKIFIKVYWLALH